MSLAKLYWVHALSGIHVGAGTGLGYIDLPVLREKTTQWPYLPGSSVKGVLADSFSATPIARDNDPWLRAAFGRADREEGGDDAKSNAGSLIFGDAHMVCLPVQSLFGTFAWITCPLALERVRRDNQSASAKNSLPAPPAVGDVGVLLVGDAGSCDIVNRPGGARTVHLVELDFNVKADEKAGTWAKWIADTLFPGSAGAWQAIFTKRFAVVHDDIFSFFAETATEVIPRVRIEPERKTVARGALWTEEYVPAESILSGIVVCDSVFTKIPDANPDTVRKDLLSKFTIPRELQIGGKATIGKGRIRLLYS